MLKKPVINTWFSYDCVTILQKKDYANMELSPEIKNSVTITASTKIADICAAFFATTGLTYYNYVRVYNDTSRICLSNNAAWMEFVFSNLDQYCITFEERIEHGASHYVIWDHIDSIGDDSLMKCAYRDFNIAHGFTIISNYSEYLEFQYFATTRDRPEMNQFYLNHLNVLHAFELYFKEKACEIIQQTETQRFKIEGHTFFWLTSVPNDASYSLLLKRFYLSGDLKDIFLTFREAQCVVALAEGSSAKEIARNLNISYRTVQGHFDNIKAKLSCNNKNVLLEKIKHNGISHIADALNLLKTETNRSA